MLPALKNNVTKRTLKITSNGQMHLRSIQWWATFIVHFAMNTSNFWRLSTDWRICSQKHRRYAAIHCFILMRTHFLISKLHQFPFSTFQIRLIVIDSFSYLFRSLESDANLIQMTHEILWQLQQIAQDFKCAVSGRFVFGNWYCIHDQLYLIFFDKL